MIPLTPPPLVEVLRADTSTLDAKISSLLEHYNPKSPGGFNYLRSIKTVRAAYCGLHQLDQLLASLPSVKSKTGFKPNQEVINLAAPLAFGRRTQVFDLSARKFSFGRNRFATYRIPFFFTENGIVKLYFLQYRKNFAISGHVFDGMYTVHKRYLLDQEFFGDETDVEYVDCSTDGGGSDRVLRQFASAGLRMWSDDRLRDQLGMVSTAMDEIERRQLGVKRLRPLKDVDLPLFD